MSSDVRVAGVTDAELLHDFDREFDTPTPGVGVLTGRLRRLLAQEDVVALLAGAPAVGLAVLTLRPDVWYARPRR